MEHARKMILVPEDSVNRLQQNIQNNIKADDVDPKSILRTVQTPGTKLTRLDTEMNDILHSNDTDENIKWKKYQQVLQRYLFYLNSNSKQADTQLSKAEVTNGIDDDIIAASVPTTWRRKAEMLLQFLKRPEVASRISWNTRGIVTIDGNVIGESNIIDLVNDVTRSRKSIKAAGREEFARFLYETGIPLEFMGNVELYKLGQKLSRQNTSTSTPNAQRSLSTELDALSPIQKRTNVHESTPMPKSVNDSSYSFDGTLTENDGSFISPKQRKRKSLNKTTIHQSGSGWLTLSM